MIKRWRLCLPFEHVRKAQMARHRRRTALSREEQLWWVMLNLTTGKLPKFLKNFICFGCVQWKTSSHVKLHWHLAAAEFNHSTLLSGVKIVGKGQFCCMWTADDSHETVKEQTMQRTVQRTAFLTLQYSALQTFMGKKKKKGFQKTPQKIKKIKEKKCLLVAYK